MTTLISQGAKVEMRRFTDSVLTGALIVICIALVVSALAGTVILVGWILPMWPASLTPHTESPPTGYALYAWNCFFWLAAGGGTTTALALIGGHRFND